MKYVVTRNPEQNEVGSTIIFFSGMLLILPIAHVEQLKPLYITYLNVPATIILDMACLENFHKTLGLIFCNMEIQTHQSK